MAVLEQDISRGNVDRVVARLSQARGAPLRDAAHHGRSCMHEKAGRPSALDHNVLDRSSTADLYRLIKYQSLPVDARFQLNVATGRCIAQRRGYAGVATGAL